MLDGTPPPASQYPQLADGTLVPVGKLAFPAIPGIQSPTIVAAARHDGKPIPFLVPQVDADGNERAGVRTAESLVATATYTGWNFRNQSIGGTKQLVSLLGSRIPFPRTPEERSASHDPRKSVEERYASHEAYLAGAKHAVDSLVKGGYLLAQDVAEVMQRMDDQWKVAAGR